MASTQEHNMEEQDEMEEEQFITQDDVLAEVPDDGDHPMDEDDDEDPAAELSVFEDKRILMDPDFDDNKDRTLESLGVTRGKFLTLVHEDGLWGATVQCALGVLR